MVKGKAGKIIYKGVVDWLSASVFESFSEIWRGSRLVGIYMRTTKRQCNKTCVCLPWWQSSVPINQPYNHAIFSGLSNWWACETKKIIKLHQWLYSKLFSLCKFGPDDYYFTRLSIDMNSFLFFVIFSFTFSKINQRSLIISLFLCQLCLSI